jgi:orotidine-5'-phosphate decarboxylase
VVRFCALTLRAVTPYVAAVKLQAAFFEEQGVAGMLAFFALAEAARRRGLITIADIKRADIGPTAQAYALAYLGSPQARASFDAVTVNPYFGTDGVLPFVTQALQGGQGVFVVVRSSNPSAAELQDLQLSDGRRVYEAVADLVRGWGCGAVGESGYSAVGAVAGATAAAALARLRHLLPQQPLLVPGYGAQGAQAEDVVAAFDSRGLGALVNSSRGLLYAYQQEPYARRYGAERFAEAAAAAARDARDAINAALARAGKSLPPCRPPGEKQPCP